MKKIYGSFLDSAAYIYIYTCNSIQCHIYIICACINYPDMLNNIYICIHTYLILVAYNKECDLVLDFFCGRVCFFLGVPGSMLSCFSDFLLLCFSAFPASLLFCFLLFLLLCFSASLFSLLLCFCTSVPFYFYYSTFSFLQSIVFAAVLPAPLLLCFLSLLSLCCSLSFALFCSVCILNETLERETQRNPKEILIRNPT